MKQTRILALSLTLALAAALNASCDTDGSACGQGTGLLAPRTFVVAKLSFAVKDENGRINGFDLDNRVSAGLDGDSCNQDDDVDPDGVPGVDNALAELFAVVHALVGNAIDGLIQMAVNDGTLLVVFRVEGLDDLENDPCVQVQMLKGTGPTVPQLATTGFLAPSQTFEIDHATPISTGRGRIENGVLYAGPFDAVIPLKFFQVYVNMRLHNASLRADITPEGGLANGVLGGGIEVDQVLEVVQQAAENDGTAQTILVIAPRAIGGLADLEFDGDRCTQASAALVFEAEPAYLIGDSLEKNNGR